MMQIELARFYTLFNFQGGILTSLTHYGCNSVVLCNIVQVALCQYSGTKDEETVNKYLLT